MYERTKQLLTQHREDVEKVAKLLLEKEVLTRHVCYICSASKLNINAREDMINLLGKRPFVGKADDMDKWLDEHQKERRPTNPPIGEASVDDPLPSPVAVSSWCCTIGTW